MKKIYAMLLMLVAASMVNISAAKQVEASSKVIVKNVTGISGFRGIVAKSIVDVVYYDSPTTTIKITASENVMPYVEVKKESNMLVVGLQKDVSVKRNKKPLKVEVSAPYVSLFSSTGSAYIYVKGAINRDKLVIGATGSGDIDIDKVVAKNVTLGITGSGDIEVHSANVSEEVTCGVSGSGDIEVKYLSAKDVAVGITGSGDVKIKSGSAENATYKVSGSGDISAINLMAGAVNAVVSGSGDVKCCAKNSIVCGNSGSGDIVYYGRPDKVKKNGKNIYSKGN